jgi:hypothetical protein
MAMRHITSIFDRRDGTLRGPGALAAKSDSAVPLHGAIASSAWPSG